VNRGCTESWRRGSTSSRPRRSTQTSGGGGRLLADHGVELRPANPDATLLELGSGGGNTASHLKARAHLTLTDVAPAMLALSATLNPECEHIEGDMRTLRLGRTFDAVLLHDAVMYMTTEADLRAAVETAFVHLRPGGALVLFPDFTAETYQPTTEHGGHDGPDGRSLRYLEWTFDPDPTDTTVGDALRVPPSRCGRVGAGARRPPRRGGLPRATWLRLLAEVGFRVDAVVAGGSSTCSWGCVLGKRTGCHDPRSRQSIGILERVCKPPLRRTSMAVRVDLNISLDGFATTTDQTPENPFGQDWARLVEAYAATRTFRPGCCTRRRRGNDRRR